MKPLVQSVDRGAMKNPAVKDAQDDSAGMEKKSIDAC